MNHKFPLNRLGNKLIQNHLQLNQTKINANY